MIPARHHSVIKMEKLILNFLFIKVFYCTKWILTADKGYSIEHHMFTTAELNWDQQEIGIHRGKSRGSGVQRLKFYFGDLFNSFGLVKVRFYT